MRRFILVLAIMALGLATTSIAWAQPAPAPKTSSDPAIETVIVTGKKTVDEATHEFIQTYAAPAPFLGKLARWNKRNPICPSAGGFPSGYDRFTVNRIKEVAARVGAPVSQRPGCKPNMAIIVTKDAQGLMGEIRAHRADLLGYVKSAAQADSLTTMNFPVQVLYETATIDANGRVFRDGGGVGDAATDRGTGGGGGGVTTDGGANTPGGAFASAGDSPSFAVTGQRARDGLESVFFNITIVVDAAKVDEYRLQMGALADYLAMVALAQTENFTPCEQLPSISSLMTPNCGTSGLTNAITVTDIAYLTGLYSSDSGGLPMVQRGGIANEVRRSLANGK